jgi:sugar/nucleoside kinase (ribokinase family)
MDNNHLPLLTIIGDVGVDVVLGPIERWPAVGTESLMDRSELRAGGSAGNAALATRYLGARCRLVSLVGNDSLGSWLVEQFHGLDTSLPACNSSTSLSVGIIHTCGERTFFTTRGHLENFSYPHVSPALQNARRRGSIALLTGAFLTPKLRRDYRRLIAEVAGLGYQVALDTGWPSGDWDDELRAEVFDWIAGSDHVLLNQLELTSLANDKDFFTALAHVSRRLKAHASLVVKNGAEGAVGFQDGVTVKVDALDVRVFDTIGAGDSFNAGYLLGRMAGQDLRGALEAGCRAAASIITRFPRREIQMGELAELLAFGAPKSTGAASGA